MLRGALIFFFIAVVAGILGFFAVVGVAASIAKALFGLFLLLFLLLLVGGMFRGRPGGTA